VKQELEDTLLKKKVIASRQLGNKP
jgi:hypothetical protein